MSVLEWLGVSVVKPVQLEAKHFWHLVDPVRLANLRNLLIVLPRFLIVLDVRPALVLPCLIKLLKANDPNHDSCEGVEHLLSGMLLSVGMGKRHYLP